MQVLLSFGGFYESTHCLAIDNVLEDHEDGSEDNQAINYDNINYKSIFKEYSKELILWLNTELPEKFQVKYIGLDSPKFYNYRTDEIQLEINEAMQGALRGLVLEGSENLKQAIFEAFSHRSGFISYYSNAIKDWKQAARNKTLESTQYGWLLDYYIKHELDIDLNMLPFEDDGFRETVYNIVQDNI